MVHSYNNSDKLPNIEVGVLFSEQGKPLKSVRLLNRSDSDTSVNIEVALMRGDYFINVSSSEHVTVSVMLVKEAIVHLKAASNYLMTRPSTFEMYPNNRSIMVELFSCYGDLSVYAVD